MRIHQRGDVVKGARRLEYNAKVLVTFGPTLPLDDSPAAWNGGLSSALSAPNSFALYPGDFHASCTPPAGAPPDMKETAKKKDGTLRCSRCMNTWDHDQAQASAKVQAALGAEIVCSGHGPVVREAAGKFPG